MTQTKKVSVLGDGGWGTALAVVNARCGNATMLWSAFPDYANIISKTRENVKFLPGVTIPEEVRVISNIKEAVEFADIIILAIPTQFLRNVLHTLKSCSTQSKTFVSVAKGIERKTGMRPSEIIRSQLGDSTRLVILSGPSHAEEVAQGIPTLVVAASNQTGLAEQVQQAITDTYFRVYVQTDEIGTELGGALKNVVAIAAGICDGLKFGDNTKSGLITRGLLEMVRLGVRVGANPNTFFGLSGLGDLVTTCFSKHGRNLRVGRELGEGKKIKDILAKMEMVAEGVASTESVYELCQKLDLDLPIMGETYNILFRDKSPRQAVIDLLQRDAHEEWKQY